MLYRTKHLMRIPDFGRCYRSWYAWRCRKLYRVYNLGFLIESHLARKISGLNYKEMFKSLFGLKKTSCRVTMVRLSTNRAISYAFVSIPRRLNKNAKIITKPHRPIKRSKIRPRTFRAKLKRGTSADSFLA